MAYQQYTDDVNGTVIGGFSHPYEFWIDEPYPLCCKRKVASNWFEDDEEAIAWFKENYPDEYKRGVEMRVWDK